MIESQSVQQFTVLLKVVSVFAFPAATSLSATQPFLVSSLNA